jgi:hypothetical protein
MKIVRESQAGVDVPSPIGTNGKFHDQVVANMEVWMIRAVLSPERPVHDRPPPPLPVPGTARLR